MIRRRNRTAACGPRPSDSGIEEASGSRPTQRMLSCARCAALSFARKDTQPNMIGTLPQAGRGHMHRTLRGPLAWALAAGLVIAACGGAGTGGASPTAAGPKLGSPERPIQLAITPSAEVQRLTATGNGIPAALGKAT